MKSMFTGAVIATAGLGTGAMIGFVGGFLFATAIITKDEPEAS